MSFQHVHIASDIAALNQSVISPDMVSLPIGRGYQFNGVSTDAPVHVQAIMPSFLNQGALLSEFEKCADQNSCDFYMGVGGLMNLSYIATLKPKAALLVDVNPVQTLFWQQIFADLKTHKRPKDFLKAARRCEDNLRDVLKTAFDGDVDIAGTQNVERFINGQTILNLQQDFPSWLKINLPDRGWFVGAQYDVLHEMAANGALGALTLDIADVSACNELADFTNSKNLKADFFHVSNIFDFMRGGVDWVGREGSPSLAQITQQNVRSLLKPETGRVVGDKDFIHLET